VRLKPKFHYADFLVTSSWHGDLSGDFADAHETVMSWRSFIRVSAYYRDMSEMVRKNPVTGPRDKPLCVVLMEFGLIQLQSARGTVPYLTLQHYTVFLCLDLSRESNFISICVRHVVVAVKSLVVYTQVHCWVPYERSGQKLLLYYGGSLLPSPVSCVKNDLSVRETLLRWFVDHKIKNIRWLICAASKLADKLLV